MRINKGSPGALDPGRQYSILPDEEEDQSLVEREYLDKHDQEAQSDNYGSRHINFRYLVLKSPTTTVNTTWIQGRTFVIFGRAW